MIQTITSVYASTLLTRHWGFKMQKLCTLAGTDIRFIELDKPIQCSDCSRPTDYIDLHTLNLECRALCPICIRKYEGI